MLILKERQNRKGETVRFDVVQAADATASYHDAVADLAVGTYKALVGGRVRELEVGREVLMRQHVFVDGSHIGAREHTA